MSIKILLADDDPVHRLFLHDALSDTNYEVFEASTGEDVVNLLLSHDDRFFDLMILDLVMPDLDGMGVLRHREVQDKLTMPIIVQSTTKAAEHVEEALDAGAIDFIIKPVSKPRLRTCVVNALKLGVMERVVHQLHQSSQGIFSFADMIGTSESFQKAMELAQRAVSSTLPILIEGEIGVGKRTFAKAIIGSRGNTLLIENVGTLSSAMQADLLQKIQDKKSDICLIATTSEDLQERVRCGKFREDLYYRLCVSPIRIPALRDRLCDIADLSRHFCARISLEECRGTIKGVSTAAIKLLETHHWTENLRELENMIFRAVHLCKSDELSPCDFPQLSTARVSPILSPIRVSETPSATLALVEKGGLRPLDTIEKETIRFALDHHKGRMTNAARELGIGRSTLYRKMRQFDIHQ